MDIDKKFFPAGFVLSLKYSGYTGYDDVFKKPRKIKDDELLPDEIIRWN